MGVVTQESSFITGASATVIPSGLLNAIVLGTSSPITSEK